VILLGGISILWYLANSQWVDQQLSRVIEKLLKRYGGLDVKDYASLLQVKPPSRMVIDLLFTAAPRQSNGWKKG